MTAMRYESARSSGNANAFLRVVHGGVASFRGVPGCDYLTAHPFTAGVPETERGEKNVVAAGLVAPKVAALAVARNLHTAGGGVGAAGAKAGTGMALVVAGRSAATG